MRSDNGAPFAAVAALAGLSRLSLWWLRLGILPERITPASPWENGRHERMHRTLKAEATMPPQANHPQQQRAFDAFRREYNEVRPHEALQQTPPATVYTRSYRGYPRKLPEFEYPASYQLRTVSDAGTIRCDGRRVFLSGVLRNQLVGLRQTDEQIWQLYVGRLLVGVIDGTRRELRIRAPETD